MKSAVKRIIRDYLGISQTGKIDPAFLNLISSGGITDVATRAEVPASVTGTVQFFVVADETNQNRPTFLALHGTTVIPIWVGPVPPAVQTGFVNYGAPQNESAYTVVNIDGTEAGFNQALSVVQPNTWIKFPANQTVSITNGINVGRSVQNVVVDLNGSTLTCSNGRVSIVAIYDGVIKGLRYTNGQITNGATGQGSNGSGYGLFGMYEAAEILPVVSNGVGVIPGLRIDHIRFSNPQLDMDCLFGNTFSTVKDGGDGRHHLHSDLVFEDLLFEDTGSAGLEYLSHAWDDNDNGVYLRNLIFRRNVGRRTGLVSTKTPRFGPLLSFSGRCVNGLVEYNEAENASYAHYEIVGGTFFEIHHNTGVTNNGGYCSGLAISDRDQSTGNLHIHHNTISTVGSSNGRGMYAYGVYNLNVEHNTFDTRQGNDFACKDSTFRHNNWHSLDYSTMRLNDHSTNNIVQENDMSNLNAAPGISAVISLSGGSNSGNNVSLNNLVRGNSGPTTEQYGGAANNVITGNFPDNQ